MPTKQEQIETEISELKRVDSQPFNSYLSPELVQFDMNVIDKPPELVQFDMNVIDKPLMPDKEKQHVISETILRKLDEESKRVKRANEILARISNIDYSLALMFNFQEVQITSLNRVGWSPKIPTDKIKEFVKQIYREERESLIVELEKLYSTSQTGQILKWNYLFHNQIWFARSADNSNWEIRCNEGGMFILIDNNRLPWNAAPFSELLAAQEWCESQETELIADQPVDQK